MFLALSIYLGSSPCAGLQVICQYTHQLRNCYTQLVLNPCKTEALPQSNWIAVTCHYLVVFILTRFSNRVYLQQPAYVNLSAMPTHNLTNLMKFSKERLGINTGIRQLIIRVIRHTFCCCFLSLKLFNIAAKKKKLVR